MSTPIGYDHGQDGPEWLMTGTRRANGGYRLYASKKVRAKLGIDSPRTGDTVITLDARLSEVLIIDGTSYGDCLNRLFQIWQPEDLGQPEIEGKKALP